MLKELKNAFRLQALQIMLVFSRALSIAQSPVAAAEAEAAVSRLRFSYRRHYSSKYLHSSLKPYHGFLKSKPMSNLIASLSSSTNTNNNHITTTPSPSASKDSAKPTPKTPPPPLQPWLIVGLGNPGKRYNSTRHNVGFEMVDRIAESEGISMSSMSFKALFGKGFIGNIPVMLAKPQTFMNVSGESVREIVSYYKIPLKQILVICDDMDLPFAKLRLLPKGGHGGHNGMKNIIDHLKGSRDFPRLRIGIGRPPGKMDSANYVLRPFTKQEDQELDFVFQNGSQAVRILLLEGFDRSANYVNSAKPLKI